jgi:hypothetical protein
MAGENGNGGAGGAGGTNTTALGGAGAEGGAGGAGGAGSNGAAGNQTSTTTTTTQVVDVAVKYPETWGKEHAFKDFVGLAKESGLKSEGAQKFVDLADKQVSTAVKAAVEARDAAAKTELETEHKRWAEELAADKDLAGVNAPAVKANIARAMTQFGDAELRALFDKTQLGNHRAFVRFVNAVGKALGEDKLGPNGNGEKREATADEVARRFFDHETSKSMFHQKG